MKYNRLGRTGLFVSEVSFGAMTFGDNHRLPGIGGVDERGANEMVARCLAAGVNLFDTADSYASGGSEIFLGKALRESGATREDYLIATKVFGPIGNGPNGAGASRAHILDGAKNSLKRLGVDHIDLYQIHGFDPATPIEETLRALDDLVRQGHVRYVGVSNWAAWQIAKALGISERLGLTSITSLQAYYSLASRDIEREITSLLKSEGVGLIVWSPLAGGFLSGKQARGQLPPPGARTEAERPPVDYTRGYDVLDAMRPVAENHGVSLSQIALAWLLHQEAVSTILIGAKSIDQLESNLGAVNIVLTENELAAIDAASRLSSEYPGWMFEMWSAERANLLAGSKR